MTVIFKSQALRKKLFYASHTFGDKRRILPLQAAEVLAWQAFNDAKHRLSGLPSRKDFIALVREQDRQLALTPEWLERLIRRRIPEGFLLDVLGLAKIAIRSHRRGTRVEKPLGN